MAKIDKWGDILGSLSSSLGNEKARSKKQEQDPSNMFPNWAKSAVESSSLEKDRETNKQKDGVVEGADNYLTTKKANKQKTPTTYNDNNVATNTPFSSPKETQQISEPTNEDEYVDEGQGGVSYSDPIISTKPTPTSIKMGVPRPGPSTFIQTARYNPMSKRLNIQYTDGKVFPYYDVSQELADYILQRKSNHSPGQTLLNTIFKGHGTTSGDEIADLEEGM